MATVNASIGKELYQVTVKSATGNVIIGDEPVAKGGQDKGFSPSELLAASLAACTCATVRMYADRKGWNLQSMNVTITLIEKEGQTTFERKLHVEGNLDEHQRARIILVANACPVHKILTGQIVINTQLV